MRALWFSSLSPVYQLPSLITFLAIGPFQPNFPEPMISNIIKLLQVCEEQRLGREKAEVPWKKEMLPCELNPHGMPKDPVKRELHMLFTPGRGPSQSLLLMSYIFQGNHGASLLLFFLVSKVILHVFGILHFLQGTCERSRKGGLFRSFLDLTFTKPMCPPTHVHETIWCNNP